MDLDVKNISSDEVNISGDVFIDNQNYKFNFDKEMQEMKIYNMKGDSEIPLPKEITDNVVEITDRIIEKISPEKALPIPPDRLGTYKIPSDKIKELDKLLKEKRIPHRFGNVKTNSNEKYVLFDKKFYPGVKNSLNSLGIKKPSLSQQIAEAKRKTMTPQSQQKSLDDRGLPR